jgi:hypothetical protein
LKKFITIILGAMFVLGMAATAFAIHAEIPAETQAIVAKGTTQVTISGNLRVRGWYLNDIESLDLDGITTRIPADTGSAAYYDERVRVQLDAVSGNTSGRVTLESGSDATDVYTWGTSSFDSKPDTTSLLEAWIMHQFDLGFPAGIKIGHMPLSLGPAKLFYDHTKFGDDAIVVFADPTPETHIAALTIKVQEQGLLSAAGGSAQLLAPAFPSGSIWNNNDDTDAYVALINQKLGDTQLGAYYVYINNSTLETKLQDLGLNAVGNIAGLNYIAQADLQFGDVAGVADLKAKGWAVWLELGYKLDPVNIRVMGAIGSGDDADDDDFHTFINFLGSNRYFTVVYDYQVSGANLTRYNGISNTTVLNVGVDLKPIDKLSLALDAYWLKATETGLAESIAGTSVDDSLGWEIDAKASYDLSKNLKYFVWAGYLNTGDFYEDVWGNDKSPTVLMHGLEYAF